MLHQMLFLTADALFLNTNLNIIIVYSMFDSM